MSAHRKPSPFPTVTQIKRPTAYIDPDLLTVEHNTPVPKTRRVNGKYEPLFAKLRYGSCVVCEPVEKERIATAMRKWLEREGKPGKVIAVKQDKDGHARVWLVAEVSK